MDSILFFAVAIIIFIELFKKGKEQLHANWNTLIDNFSYSPQEFYSKLSSELESHGITNIKLNSKNISTGGAFSAKRIYLSVTWKNYTYDCCCAPFGNGMFFSWFMYSKKTGFEKLISKIPFAGAYLCHAFFPVTYYTVDTASMFMTYAQNSMQKVINDISKEGGVRILSEQEKKPILQDFFKR